jgi:capsular polysaccharide biosynthesis protein
VLEETGLQNKYSVDQLKAMVTTEIINQTEIFEITVTGESGKEVADIANVYSRILPEKLKEIVEGSDVRLVDYAEESKAIVSPNYREYMIVGALAGALIALVALLLREFLDDGIGSEEYLTSVYGEIPLLAVIPDAKEPKNGNYRKYKNYYKRYYRSYYNSGKKGQNGGKAV